VLTLIHNHPNFEEPLRLVHSRLLLGARSGARVRMPPILLWGDPGVGKTHVARELAKALGAPTRTVDFAAGAENSALLGLDRQWANTHHGVLFEMICLGDAANPFVILEEIDKTHRYSGSCPLDALHTLLEPSTSINVRDLSLEFSFDAGLATY
jgi:ATP-dependent Lon protease